MFGLIQYTLYSHTYTVVDIVLFLLHNTAAGCTLAAYCMTATTAHKISLRTAAVSENQKPVLHGDDL